MSNEYEDFVRIAHAALVLRGYEKASEIDDPILKNIWKLGQKLAKADESQKYTGE